MFLIRIFFQLSSKDLDVDNQTDGGTLVMSGPDTDSESDVPDALETEEFPETSYIHCPEDEFGAVSSFFLNNYNFKFFNKLYCFSGWRTG